MKDIYDLVTKEMDFGFAKYGKYHNSHEHYAVLQEEVDEWWESIKKNIDFAPCNHYELIQIAAVALRYVMERGDIDEIKAIQEARHAR